MNNLKKEKKLIIVGDSAFAEIAYEYFTHDSAYEVVAFAVEEEFITKKELFGLPVIPFETMEKNYSPKDHAVYAAMVYSQVNRLRARMAKLAKEKGYALASYISSKAFVWQNVKLGEHCFIFENNVVQPFVTLGDNVVLWSGNHIGHHSTIGSNCFISSHVVISGFVNVGENCFLGVNATLANNLTMGNDCWIGPNVIISRDVPENSLYKPTRFQPADVGTLEFFKVTP